MFKIQYFESFGQKWISYKESYQTLLEAKKEALKRRKRIEKDNVKRELASNSGINAYGSQSIPPMRIKNGKKKYPATPFDAELYKKYKLYFERD